MQRKLWGSLGPIVGIKRTISICRSLNVGRTSYDSINMHRGGKVYRVKQLREQVNQADKNVLKPVHKQRAFSFKLMFYNTAHRLVVRSIQ